MNKSTYIAIVLDRSGSMESIAKETINGFNAFLKEQTNVKGNAKITLVQFDHEYQIVYEAIDIGKVPGLNPENYIPRGLTALLDAIGKTINSTREKINKMKEKVRPSKVIFVVITDGQENHSRHYNRNKIFKKIRKMEEKYGWEFVFLGANQDAIAEAAVLGIKANKSMTYAADSAGASEMFLDLSRNIAECREQSVAFRFTDEQREKQKREN